MHKEELDILFKNLINIFPLESYAVDKRLKGRFPKLEPSTSVWEAVDVFYETRCSHVCIGKDRYVECSVSRKVRVPFFILLAEFESRLFRIHEWNGKSPSTLNEKHLNDFIKELVDSKLFKAQNIYKNKREFRDDLKAISSFRNVIMHVNKKLELAITIDIIFRRKNQIFKLLEALQQILDNMEGLNTKR